VPTLRRPSTPLSPNTQRLHITTESFVAATASSESPSDGGTKLAFVRMVTAAGVAATSGDAVVVSPISVATDRVSDQGTHQCGAAGITQC